MVNGICFGPTVARAVHYVHRVADNIGFVFVWCFLEQFLMNYFYP